jgi:hypothetical protein
MCPEKVGDSLWLSQSRACKTQLQPSCICSAWQQAWGVVDVVPLTSHLPASNLVPPAVPPPRADASPQAVAAWQQQLLQPWQQQHGQLPPAVVELLAGETLAAA